MCVRTCCRLGRAAARNPEAYTSARARKIRVCMSAAAFVFIMPVLRARVEEAQPTPFPARERHTWAYYYCPLVTPLSTATCCCFLMRCESGLMARRLGELGLSNFKRVYYAGMHR